MQSQNASRKERNREAVRRHRERAQRDEDEMEALYKSNEEKIARLEKMADKLSAELKKPHRHRWTKTKRILSITDLMSSHWFHYFRWNFI